MNPVPDADLYSVGEASFDWIVDAMARLTVKRAQSPVSIEIVPHSQTQPQPHWSTFLSGATAPAEGLGSIEVEDPDHAGSK